ncbi:UDP-N-acetylmuramoyl-L-alanine--D-glutamate ligase [Porticoccus sp.]|uniref:UDP-N-acetylmuramoyl-L-alanine--D-glutamate ligase n=1 Tax=Porticoccus sp. TaxID=2024853 RepID=UPI000C5B4CAE|nr:UDP-N-acetylmuramoyl-L-alanine--D-glutamate ligase [Porticoccus sp.]MAZ69035.1 UDP-N-acetylmuramoyl-L-alanine--D-glutamate ligase [Porticoccus sp.]|tara:strand:+ start:8358 stop:9701 length:1344 start_codon:yes stop_codon:yes gene_type:complete
MTQLIASSKLKVIAGLGVTGLSVARHLNEMGERFVVLDSRTNPPCLAQLQDELPEVSLALGELSDDAFLGADEVILSPGLSRQHPAVKTAIEAGIPVISDIELFARRASAPIVAITGSNGKSTVTTLVGEMFAEAGIDAAVGGNLGVPALDLLAPSVAYYVLELSSFQLESVLALNAEVATVLNISLDHMDRYRSLLDYHQAKHRIFIGARQVVTNRDDRLSAALVGDAVKQWSFGLDQPDFKGFGLRQHQGESWLYYQFEPLLAERELGMTGRHNTANALAALALGTAAGLPIDPMLAVLRRFEGLPHRCQRVVTRNGVTYINDSKATNVGATLAAIAGLRGADNLVLIAGGQGKGQDFAPLASALSGAVRQLILMGEDAPVIGDAVAGTVPVLFATDLDAAVKAAAQVARPGDTVLLSPACASFDMFRGFADRGEQFVRAAEALR